MVELLVTTMVLVILLSVGLPEFSEFIRNQRIKSTSFDLFSTLVLARSEAIARNASVTVAPAGGDWVNGWTVTDTDGNVIRNADAITSVTITGPTSVVYRGSGRLTNAVLPEFEITSTGDNITMRCISIDLSGRPRSKAEAC